jgi:hypothetical protein
MRPFVAEHLDCPRITFITESGPIRKFGEDLAIAPISGVATIRELKLSILSPTPALDSGAWLP